MPLSLAELPHVLGLEAPDPRRSQFPPPRPPYVRPDTVHAPVRETPYALREIKLAFYAQHASLLLFSAQTEVF